LGIIDVFSRKVMIYKHNNKEAEPILQNIIEFCLINGFPQEFASDNGPEFKNKNMQNFCIKENIKYINGIPYNPHSQGTIERFHYTIKKYLAKEFITNGYQKLNFSEVRIRVMNFYNNKKHRLIGMTPNQAAKLTNENDINKVNKIKEKEFNKINLKRTYLETNNSCLLNPNFILIGKSTLIPNYIKKGKYKSKIPVKVLKKAGFGYYKIKFYAKYRSIKNIFKKGAEYIADSKLLKKIKDKTWKSIVSELNNKN